jgi:6-phosphofructokinase 1
MVSSPEHLLDPDRVAPLKRSYEALRSIGAQALISIGGDDTLKTANKMKMFQDTLPPGSPRLPVVHLPKTIDNDYHGIDFTFGYFTAVDMMAHQIRNLTADAKANNAYFFVQAMGRKAGWLAYGAAIAGEASLVISLEDLPKDWWSKEDAIDPKTGQKIVKDGKPLEREVFDVYKVADWVLDVMLAREKHGKQFGVVVVAEGMAEFLPVEELKKCITDDEFRTLEPDPHGHYPVSQVPFSRRLGAIVAEKYAALPKGQKLVSKRKIVGLVSGYEVRCNPPTAFDVMLGSQLGVGAYRALAEEKLDGVMVSLHGQLALSYVPFIDRANPDKSLINPETLRAQVRLIKTGEDFHLLARYLETRLEG